MSRCPSFCDSRLRQVLGAASSRERSYQGVAITRSVHDNHFCAVNPCFVAVVTECAGGGSFLVLPIHQTGRVDPQHPRVCGHQGRVLDVKWNPFDDHCVASCSEDCTVRLWDIPAGGVRRSLTQARKTLAGHSRRVGLIEWHPTAENLLLSSAYDYKVLLWDVSQGGAVLRRPIRVLLRPVYQRHPAEALLLSACFNADGSRLALTSRDRRVRVLDPRSGKILQVSRSRSHRANKVLYAGGLKLLLSTGSSPWNQRQVVLWDPEDLSEPVHQEDLDQSSAGVLFPFYDPDTHLLFLAGKGDGSVRCYQLSRSKPHMRFLSECRSPLPHRGLGVMPKRGLDVSRCEVFRFYRLIAVGDLVQPLSMLVPRKKAAVFHEDPYPPTAGDRAAVTAEEWLRGVDRGPVLVSLRPGTAPPSPRPPAEEDQRRSARIQVEPPAGAAARDAQPPEEVGRSSAPGGPRVSFQAFLQEQLAYQHAKYPREPSELVEWQPDDTQSPAWAPRRQEPTQTPLLEVRRQQEQVRELQEELQQVTISQLETEARDSPRPPDPPAGVRHACENPPAGEPTSTWNESG